MTDTLRKSRKRKSVTKSVGTKRATKKTASTKPKKHDGWYWEKRRRAKRRAEIAAAGISPSAELIPMIGELETVEDFKREIADIYRRTRAGLIHNSDASRLTYICAEGAKLARIVDELREIAGLREQLEQNNSVSSMLHSMHADSPNQVIDQG